MGTRREKLEAYLLQPEHYGPPVPTLQELSALTEDELLTRVANKFEWTREEADGHIKYSLRADVRMQKQHEREAARLTRLPSRKMTLEHALERAQELEDERMELVKFINTIPDQELDNVERLTGMWARPKLNSDSGYTLSKLAKIFKIVLNGRRDPTALQAKLDAIGR